MTGPPARLRPARADVSLDAIRHNVAMLCDVAAGSRLCAVVKADAYGHGAVPVARAALEAGASWLAVAVVDEAAELRQAGIEAPILLLSEPPAPAMADAVALDLRPTIYTEAGLDALKAAAAEAAQDVCVHVKVDTGMHRVGCAPESLERLAAAVVASPHLSLEGVWTHFAVADEPGRNDFTKAQIQAFDDACARLAMAGIEPELRHASNSAGLLAHPSARYDVVRAGIALYGCAPSPHLDELSADLRPALSLRAEVSYVKKVGQGEGISYGLHYVVDRDSTVATVPLGYADGVPRSLSFVGGEVLIGGRRFPIAGAVTMDQFCVDCGDREVSIGDEVVLIGSQGDDRITADDWAKALGTINYEILCGIGPRVPRTYV